MAERIKTARRLVAAAADETDDATVREQLHSVDDGLGAVAEAPDGAEKGDRLEEIERKLVALGDDVEDDAVHERLEDVRDLLDAYRRDDAPNW